MAGKREIVDSIMESVSSKVGRKEVEEVLNLAIKAIDTRTKAGERIVIKGFGTFRLKDFRQKKGRNPQTGEDLIIAARKKLVLEVN